ncbi:hypothetical protein [Candidatus Berkiella aquae]|uniref:DUF1269 domain-containing protein n=1 Tax=Candidatus Berkiella aquae TaxID=295108 RepID=A0A0Q9YV68_9GAMM|nr:hypothetical protein [Candidatus Berkiella aquae]MCS5711313.1 hypothetical protein [Candidatus Berkiella aquae]
MKRLFLLVPDLKVTKEIVHELEAIGINDSNVHVMGNASETLKKEHLHEANLIQTTDLIPSLKRGAMIGIALSIVMCSVYAYALTTDGEIHLLVIAILVLFGLLFGAWASSLIGVSVKNPIVEKFNDYIKSGHYIMMVDTPPERESELSSQIISHHHDVKLVAV